VNPLKLHHRYKTQRISVIIANTFIDMYAKCGVIHVESLLAEVERNLSISLLWLLLQGSLVQGDFLPTKELLVMRF